MRDFRSFYNQRQFWHWNYLDYGLANSFFLRELKKICSQNEIHSILDLGCGSTNELRDYCKSSNIVYFGLDRIRTPEVVPWEGVRFPKEIPHSFDLIVSNGFLHYAPDLEILFEEISKHLIKGRLLVSTPLLSPLSTFDALAEYHEHWRIMPKGAETLMGRYGIKLTNIIYPGGTSTFLSILNSLLFWRLIKGKDQRLSKIGTVFFPIFLIVTIINNFLGLLLNHFAKSEAFASFYIISGERK